MVVLSKGTIVMVDLLNSGSDRSLKASGPHDPASINCLAEQSSGEGVTGAWPRPAPWEYVLRNWESIMVFPYLRTNQDPDFVRCIIPAEHQLDRPSSWIGLAGHGLWACAAIGNRVTFEHTTMNEWRESRTWVLPKTTRPHSRLGSRAGVMMTISHHSS
jgi:hypothetical protein